MPGPKQLPNQYSLGLSPVNNDDLSPVNNIPQRSHVFSGANFSSIIPKWSIVHFLPHLYLQQGEWDTSDVSCTHWSEFAFPSWPLLLSAKLLSLPGIFLSAAITKVCTSVHFHPLPRLLPELLWILSAASAISFPQQGWELSFSLLLLVERKKKIRLRLSGWENEWAVRHSFSNASLVLWGSLSRRAEASQVMIFPDSRGWPSHSASVRLEAVRVTGRSSQP